MKQIFLQESRNRSSEITKFNPDIQIDHEENSKEKINLKQIIVVIVTILFPLIASAQNEDFKNSTPEQRAQFQTDWMKTELSLDSSITTFVYSVNLKYAKKNQSLMNSGGSRVQKYREFKASSEAKDNELKKILTKEQYKEYLERKEEMKQNMRQKLQERRKN